MDTIYTEPSATPVIQALRSIGYNARTAIADIVDNSIDAKATYVHLEFEYDMGNGYIRIEDNGIGMTDEELQKAMTIGSKDPRDKREKEELGRFGMGLKTASFSLGKRLCIITKKDGIVSERCWDLDYVSDENEWLLFKSIPAEVKDKVGHIEEENGTVIFIDRLDRFCGFGTHKILKKESYYSKIKRIHKYLEMVFHIKLEQGLLITINGNSLYPWNPFLEGNQRRIEGEEQVIRVNKKLVKITPYVLPHPSTFNQVDYKYAGGVKGWRDQQGFYIYRENRLVSFGDWFGMFSKEVPSELVRIKVEFSNEADDDWKIDVKKSVVSVPDEAKEDLMAIAKYYRQLSKEIMLYRTKATRTGEKIKGTLNTWELASDDVNSVYILNRTHPVLTDILKTVSGDVRRKLNVYLKLIELGSPNNLLKTANMVKKEVQQIDEKSKKLIIDYAEILFSTGIQLDAEKVAETISMMAGFEGIEIYTIRTIIEKEVDIDVSSNT
ncbi:MULTISPECIES: ATP-binding protein [Bacillus cereus group]|uniref:ATP-binding protein n=1 Tax=Bacillus cereus group TaxID=86661 RepID=UPI000BF224B5|nr:ATP-binding protein [Bacillus wiedmannii]MCP9280765.1 ATP-binding protein [Bacillus wiedmannii]PEN50369.1 ATP-binding protein [Bacillus wiedmannii]PEO59686.1 ATP-binding protein [Bacillus wiedmannii]PEO94530.1 ATP-binding protein [Bacillus wiedmannii]PGC73725.1 ATP-binding protein [Bacillus wiedmannii]